MRNLSRTLLCALVVTILALAGGSPAGANHCPRCDYVTGCEVCARAHVGLSGCVSTNCQCSEFGEFCGVG